MLTFSQGLQIAAVALGAVLLTFGVGFWVGIKSAHSRPRLGGFLGFLGIAGLALGPLAILAATLQFSLTACLAIVAGWLVVSGLALGVVMTSYGRGHRSSFNVWFIQAMYLVGGGVVFSGLSLHQLVFYKPDHGAENIDLWGRHIGVFSLTAMAYGALGFFVLWMYRWSRSGMAQATPLVPNEKFIEAAPVVADRNAGPVPMKIEPPKPEETKIPSADSGAALGVGPADKSGASTVPAPNESDSAVVPAVNSDSTSPPSGDGRARLILRNGVGKLVD